MKIKEASILTGVDQPNIRYYERIGLIPIISRDANGIRDLSDQDIESIKYAKHMRDVGIPISSLSRYIELFREGATKNIPARKEILKEQLKVLDQKISRMQNMQTSLAYKLEHYDDIMVELEKKLNGEIK